jgi:phosphoglycolate phosphatase
MEKIMKFKSVIFDLDGTLINTLDDLTNSLNVVLKMNGLPEVSIDECRRDVGWGLKYLIQHSINGHDNDEELVDKCVIQMKSEYKNNLLVKTRPYQGIPEMLSTIAEGNIPISVLSNKDEDLTVRICAELFSKGLFATVKGGRNDIPRKPDPTRALEIAEIMKSEPADVLYVGDSGVDMNTACNAGMFAAGVLWGYRDAEVLKNAGAKILINKPEEIIRLLF